MKGTGRDKFTGNGVAGELLGLLPLVQKCPRLNTTLRCKTNTIVWCRLQGRNTDGQMKQNTIANWYQLRTGLVPLGMGLVSPATLKVEEWISFVTRVPGTRRNKTTDLQISSHQAGSPKGWSGGVEACFGDNQDRDTSYR
jgi:hypothetical protein